MGGAFAAHCAGALPRSGETWRERPRARVEMARACPEGRSRHGRQCRCRCWDRAALSTRRWCADLVLIRATSSDDLVRSCGKSGQSRTVHVMTRLIRRVRHVVARAFWDASATGHVRCAPSRRCWICAGPCKALRFAPPARARGLRALTVPARRSRLGHYAMVGNLMTLSWTDLDR
jgi:hypothetical protein